MNPLSPDLMSRSERRAELCGLLARGLVRLRMREHGDQRGHGDGHDDAGKDGRHRRREPASDHGEICLHLSSDRCRHATPTHRRTA